MTTITINERTKAGKIVLELAKMLSVTNKGVVIDSGLNKPVATKTEKSPYDPKFVAKIKRAEKRGNYKTVDPNDVWGSLGLK